MYSAYEARLPFHVSVHKFEVLTLDVTEGPQPVSQAVERRPFLIRKNTDAKSLLSLRLRSKRPDCHCAENRDELAPMHVPSENKPFRSISNLALWERAASVK